MSRFRAIFSIHFPIPHLLVHPYAPSSRRALLRDEARTLSGPMVGLILFLCVAAIVGPCQSFGIKPRFQNGVPSWLKPRQSLWPL